MQEATRVCGGHDGGGSLKQVQEARVCFKNSPAVSYVRHEILARDFSTCQA